MNPRSLLMSLGLHLGVGLAMIWVAQVHTPTRRPLPEATVVKLIQPASINVPPPSKLTQDIKFPEPKETKPGKEQEITPEKKPPLEIPNKNKKENVTEKPAHGSQGDSNAPKVPKELIGEGVTLRLKNPGFEYDFYLGIVQAKLEQNFRPPPGKQKAKAVVAFVIQKNGEISNIELQQPSGNLLVDQAAQRAVRAAGRFPPLPAQYGSDQLAINIEFVANPGSGR